MLLFVLVLKKMRINALNAQFFDEFDDKVVKYILTV